MGNSPLKKSLKKNRIISSREKRTEMFDSGDQIRLPGKKRRPSSTKDIKDLWKFQTKIGHDRSTIFPPLPPPSAHRPAQAAAGHVGAAWRTARGSCAVPNPRNPMEDVPMIPNIPPPHVLNPWDKPVCIRVPSMFYFMLDQNHCHHVMFVQVLTIYIYIDIYIWIYMCIYICIYVCLHVCKCKCKCKMYM